MTKIRTSLIQASNFYKKNCSLLCTSLTALLGMALLLYGFYLTRSIISNDTAITSSILNLSVAKSGSHASFFAISGSALLGGAIAISGIFKQRQTARSKNTVDFEAALEDSDSYNTSYERVKKIVAKRDKYPIAGWAEDDEASSDDAKAIKTVLNYWERASNGVRKDVYDSDFLYDIYGTHVLNLHKFMLPFIRKVRQGDQPKAFEQFLALSENWRVKRQAEERKAERIKASKEKAEARKSRKSKSENKKNEQGRVETRTLE